MMNFTKTCYFEGCTTQMAAATQAQLESMLLLHIKLVHLDDLLKERAMRMNSIQAKNAEDNMKRFQQLATAGLKKQKF